MSRVKDPRDFWSGILFIAFGCAGLWIGRNYAIGTLSRMGPGFFPMMMSIALIGTGELHPGALPRRCGRADRADCGSAAAPDLAAIVAFGLLIERVGLAVSVITVAVISGIAAQGLRWFELAALALAMSALSVVLFVYLLGQPIPVWVR